MKVYLLMLLAAISAFVIPFQTIVNGRMGQLVQNPFLAAVTSFGGGFAILLVILFFYSRGVPTVPQDVQIPWYLYLGGLLGAIYVTTVLIVVPQIGTANVIAAAIVGQLVMSLIIDHFGLLGTPHSPISLTKVGGAILLIVGTLLIKDG